MHKDMILSALFREERSATTKEVVGRIVDLNTRIQRFWSNAHGWAPAEAAQLLAVSRLDWQVSLSHYLRRLIQTPKQPDQADAHLIHAWVHLGAMVENTLKFVLCVFQHGYTIDHKSVAATLKDPSPDGLMLEKLKVFFSKKVWHMRERERWFPFVELVQQRRNAIHAYRTRELGTMTEFRRAVREYYYFLKAHHDKVPYPDEFYP